MDLDSILYRVFADNESTVNNITLDNHLSLSGHNVFQRSLVVDIKDNIEIPIIGRKHFENEIMKIIKNESLNDIDKIVFSLYNTGISVNKRSFESVLNYFFDRVPYDNRIHKVVTSKGEIYYGGKGIIFDSNYEPLLIMSVTANKGVKENGDIVYYYDRPLCRVNPKVFLDTSKLVNKGIVNKIIPYITSVTVPFSTWSREFIKISNTTVQVIIDDLSHLILTPTPPVPSEDINASFNSCLTDNIEDIITDICL